MDRNPGTTTKVFVMSALVRILKASPSSHVIDEYMSVVRSPIRDVGNHLSEGGASFEVLAWQDSRAVGSAAGYIRDGAGRLGGVYVTPSHRGAGLLARLVEPLEGCLNAAGCELRLQVHEDNQRARRAYDKVGFVLTGERQPYRLDSSRDELTMVKPLA